MEGVLIIVKNVKSKILFLFCFLLIGCTKTNKMIDLSNKSIDEIKEYAIKNELNLEIDYEFSDIEKDKIISQSIEVDSNINKNVTDELGEFTVTAEKYGTQTYKIRITPPSNIGDIRRGRESSI